MTTPRKPSKKRTKPATMKPWTGYCHVNKNGDRRGPATGLAYLAASKDIRTARVLVTELTHPTDAEKLEEVRKLCDRFALVTPMGKLFKSELRDILNKPAREGRGRG